MICRGVLGVGTSECCRNLTHTCFRSYLIQSKQNKRVKPKGALPALTPGSQSFIQTKLWGALTMMEINEVNKMNGNKPNLAPNELN
jgi:hypothetical protein